MSSKNLFFGLILSVLFGCSVYSHDNADYAFIHRDVWRRGLKCRHAAGAVVYVAKLHGLKTSILLFECKPKKNDKITRHAIPIIYLNGNWIAYETVTIGSPENVYSEGRASKEYRYDIDFYNQIFVNRKYHYNRKLTAMLAEIEYHLTEAEYKEQIEDELNEKIPGWRRLYTEDISSIFKRKR